MPAPALAWIILENRGLSYSLDELWGGLSYNPSGIRLGQEAEPGKLAHMEMDAGCGGLGYCSLQCTQLLGGELPGACGMLTQKGAALPFPNATTGEQLCKSC